MTEQMELVQTAEIVDIKNLNVLEQERILYMAMTSNVDAEAKKQIAAIKNAKTAEDLQDAVDWCNEKREGVKQIEGGFTFKVKSILHKKWKEFNGELDTYVAPTEKAIKDVMAIVTAKRTEIKAKLAAIEAAKNAKLEEKAKAKQAEAAQALIEQGKARAAKVVMNKPLTFTPISMPMPKIKDAVWKKTYSIKIDNLGEILAYIAKNPKYFKLIDQETLTGRLESLAVQLDGNMAEFKGITCYQGENHALGGGK